MTYKYCKTIIVNKSYKSKEEMFEMLDVFLLRGRISQQEYEELSGILVGQNDNNTD